MKKHLLFTAMLALGAAAAVATTQAVPYYAAAEDETSTPATEAEYNELQTAVEEAVAKIDSLSKAVEEKYPESYVLVSLKETKEALQKIGEEAEAKYTEGTLTSEEVTAYMATVKEYSEGMDGAMAAAELEEYQTQVYSHYSAANSAVATAMDNMPESVANYYYNSVDSLYPEMNTLYTQSTEATTVEEFQKIFDGFDAIATKADSLAKTISAAAALVDSISTTLDSLAVQMEKVKADFPDYDLSYTEKAASYWKDFAEEFKSAPAEGKSPYNMEDIEFYTQNFGYFQDEATNLYATAQMEEFMAEFNQKYYPVNDEIYEYQMNLYDECSHLSEEEIANYYNALDDLSAELSQMFYVLYGDPISRAEFDKMLARIDEIEKEAKEIYDAAIEAENVATGINTVSADSSANAKVFTFDGKAVESVKGLKGAYIVNGKKVILK